MPRRNSIDAPLAERRYWTQAEAAFLKLHYAEQRTDLIAQALNRPHNTVLAKANSLGLSKSKALIAEMAREHSSQPNHGGHRTA